MQDSYWLRNGRIAVEVIRVGASLHRFEIDGRNIVLARPDPTAASPEYLGSTVGRVANRIEHGQFALDGKSYQVEVNNPVGMLHGGSGGWSELPWDLVEAGDTKLVLGFDSPDGDMGFPGRVRALATYTVLPNGLRIDYAATTDAPTVVAMTNHAYYNLKGDGVGDMLDHTLQMHSSAYTPSVELITTGEIRDVTGTPLDFRTPQLVGEALEATIAAGLHNGRGFDHNFVIDGSGMREQLVLTSPDGLKLRVSSDAPGVQIFDGDNLDGSIVNPEGRPYVWRGGLAIEPQNFPGAVHHSNFPSPVLRPGEQYSLSMVFEIE
jgi:aldose 1-epimerase